MRFLKEFYLTSRFLLFITGIVLLFFFGYFIPILFFAAKAVLISFITIIIIESLILFLNKGSVFAERILADRLSNGDENQIKIILTNNYAIKAKVKIIDELPFIFQIRDFEINSDLEKNTSKIYAYNVRPVKRGEYQFGALNIYVSTILNIVSRRYRFEQNKNVAVYPSYIQMKKYLYFIYLQV
jgi:uncharacterized protein (DUF58 family)